MSSAARLIFDQVNTFRNPTSNIARPNPYKIALAEIAYISIVPFAMVEAAFGQIAKIITCCLPVNNQKYQTIRAWAANSSQCIHLAISAVVMNFFTRKIVINQQGHASFISSNPVHFLRLSSMTSSAETPGPPVVEPAVANILNHYELGNQAKAYSDTLEKLYSNLPDPIADELNEIGNQISNLLTDRYTPQKRNKIKDHLDTIAKFRLRTQWEDRYIKMVVSLYRECMAKNDSSFTEIVKMAFEDAYNHCSNRQSIEIERLFFHYVAPHLNSAYLQSLTPLQTLIFDMMQYRMQLRDTIINIICNDPHNAASHNKLRRDLNTSIFYLPPSLLSSVNLEYASFAMTEKEPEVIKAFRNAYDSPNTIYTIFLSLLYPKQGEVFQFKPAMFVKWLETTGRMNEGSFENEDMTKYKPQIIIDYLEALGFLKTKNQ